MGEPRKNAIRVPFETRQALNVAIERWNQAEICRLLLVEVKRQGVNAVAERAAMTRGSMYSALGEGANPTMSAMLKISGALGITWRCIAALRHDFRRDKSPK